MFSSDPISSTAYATEEILLVLVGATLAGGVLATGLAMPVALAIVALLALLVVSYRQVVDAYPSAGGAYVVSRDNFGNVTAAVAGAALLIDYVLTVAVSVSSGVAAMSSVWPDQLGRSGSRSRSPSWSCSPGATCAASARPAGSSPSPPTCTWSASPP